jgi:hypothetical protein
VKALFCGWSASDTCTRHRVPHDPAHPAFESRRLLVTGPASERAYSRTVLLTTFTEPVKPYTVDAVVKTSSSDVSQKVATHWKINVGQLKVPGC